MPSKAKIETQKFPSKIKFYGSFAIRIILLYWDLVWDVVVLYSFFNAKQYEIFTITIAILSIQIIILFVWNLTKSVKKDDGVLFKVIKIIGLLIFSIIHMNFLI